jgi:hypothetical protein
MSSLKQVINYMNLYGSPRTVTTAHPTMQLLRSQM